MIADLVPTFGSVNMIGGNSTGDLLRTLSPWRGQDEGALLFVNSPSPPSPRGSMNAELAAKAKGILQRYEHPRAAMLPLLWLVQENQGYISPEAEAWVGHTLGVARSHVREVVSFYNMFHTKPVGRRELRVCTSLPCLLRGAGNVLDRIKERLKINPGETTPGREVTLTEVECLCACEMSPMAQLDQAFVGPLEGPTLDSVLQAALENPKVSAALPEPEPYISTNGPVLSTRFKNPDGTWLADYVADGGYQAAKKVLSSLTPADVIDAVSKANLRGLGGAGFPTGRKWSFIPKETTKPKYLVVNADEGEPGTFKDRYILERDPHALLEGMIIAAYAIGSHKAYVYIRGEYFRSAQRLQRAIDEATTHGWLGKNIQGTGFDLDVVIHRGAARISAAKRLHCLRHSRAARAFPNSNHPSRPYRVSSSARPSSTTWRRWPACHLFCGMGPSASPPLGRPNRVARGSSACAGMWPGLASTRSRSVSLCASSLRKPAGCAMARSSRP